MFSQDLAPGEGRGGIESLAHVSVVLRRDSHLCSPGVRSCLAAVSCPLVRVPPQGPDMIALPPLVGAGRGPWAGRTSPGPDRGVSSFGMQTHGFAPAMDNDPSAGSPTETLLRLLLPLNDQIRTSFICTPATGSVNCQPGGRPKHSLNHSSVVATGGVYKGQGRNQRELVTHTYWEFLVHGG